MRVNCALATTRVSLLLFVCDEDDTLVALYTNDVAVSATGACR